MSTAESPSAHGDEGRARVAYLGPEGTFTQEALLGSARVGAVEPIARASIYETVAALREREVDFALVPIENSLDGSVTVTLDLLADAREVRIVGEALLRVSHALIGAVETPLERIATVLTHPQVPGQCTRLLRGDLAHARVQAASSTAEAVRTIVLAGAPEQAAIGTELAARIYGGTVLRAHVEDRADNETRFVWLACDANAAPPLRERGTEWKTSLVFWGEGAERAGWLVRCLDEFARRAINLTKIESRPHGRGLGSYMFFADLAAREQEAHVQEAVGGVASMCEQVRVLGSFPAASGAETAPT